jgi:AGZA family xanthine/uracil permease-like MFS transporter
MGLNAFFTYGICLGAGVSWQVALGIVFWCSVAFVLLTVTGAREAILRGVPRTLQLAAAVGIGLFIAFIGLQQGGLVTRHPETFVALGDVTATPAWLTLAGLGVALALAAAGVATAIFWGMMVTLALGLATGSLAAPSEVARLPAFDFPGLELGLLDALRLEYVPLMLVLLFFQIFDTLGTLVAVAHAAGITRDGRIPRIERALAADALGSLAGALFGTSTVTAYIESGSGVAVGGRTGLASLTTGFLFVAAAFFTPLVAVVGQGMVVDGKPYNPMIAPALIAVGTLMVRAVREIDWEDATEAVPAFFTILLMPTTFNISHGLAVGVLAYVLVKVAARRWREVHWLMYALAGAFVLRYALLPV